MPNLYKVQDHGKDLLGRSLASHMMPWFRNMLFPVHIILISHQNLPLFFTFLISQHKRLMWHPNFLPLSMWFWLMHLHLVQVLLLRLEEFEQWCHNLFVLSTRTKNAPHSQGGRRLLQHKLLGHQTLVSKSTCTLRKHTIFHWLAYGMLTSNVWNGVKACEYIVA